MMAMRSLLGWEQVPWDWVVPSGAAVAAASAAFVVSRFVFRKPEAPPPPPAPPPEKTTPEYDPFAKGSASDQREAYRRGGHPIEIHIAEPSKEEKVHDGWILDRSVGGLCVITKQPLPEDSLWTVRAAK